MGGFFKGAVLPQGRHTIDPSLPTSEFGSLCRQADRGVGVQVHCVAQPQKGHVVLLASWVVAGVDDDLCDRNDYPERELIVGSLLLLTRGDQW